MKTKVILAISILAIFLAGCESKQEINLVDKGKAALEKHEYTEAKDLLSQALEIDSTDEHARAMYVQASRMLEMEEYKKQKNYKKAINELEIIENIKGGSTVIKNEASTIKKELEKLKDEHEKAQQERKQNAKKTSSNDTYKVEREALKQYEEQKRKEEEKKKQEQLKQEQLKQEQINQEQNNQQNANTNIQNTDNAEKSEVDDVNND